MSTYLWGFFFRLFDQHHISHSELAGEKKDDDGTTKSFLKRNLPKNLHLYLDSVTRSEQQPTSEPSCTSLCTRFSFL